ncbi:MAG: hypothetical protein WC350_03065 [Candidatus Micrarchaeia archaeon]
MRTTVIFHEGRLPMFGIAGEIGAQVGKRIRAAIAKGKKTPILERTVGITGRVELNGEGHSAVRASGSSRSLQLGSGHLYARTSNAALFLRVLESVSCTGDGGIVLLNAEPSYHSSAAMNGENRISITEGSSSLISAMHGPLDLGYHAAIREKLRLFFGAEFSMREVLLALPCAAAMDIAEVTGRYAIPAPVPLHDLVVLNECDGEVLEEFCIAEAPLENMRQGGGLKIKELANEMVGRVRGMKNSVEMPGTSW